MENINFKMNWTCQKKKKKSNHLILSINRNSIGLHQIWSIFMLQLMETSLWNHVETLYQETIIIFTCIHIIYAKKWHFQDPFSNYPAIQLLNLHFVSVYNLLTGQLTGMLILGLENIHFWASRLIRVLRVPHFSGRQINPHSVKLHFSTRRDKARDPRCQLHIFTGQI